MRPADTGQRIFPADQFYLISEGVRQLTVEIVNDHSGSLAFFNEIAWRSQKYFDEPPCSRHWPPHLFDILLFTVAARDRELMAALRPQASNQCR
ncbi:hypothetical protein WL06_01760 [Burkholderia cepacia]|nr:hypothetical protein WL06_01760 [Burkholderia cepacia]